MQPQIGSMLASTVDDTTVVVVRWATGEREVTCGGSPMVDAARRGASPHGTIDPQHAAGTLLGKRYTPQDGTVELLCTRPGKGTLAVDGTPMVVKAAKP